MSLDKDKGGRDSTRPMDTSRSMSDIDETEVPQWRRLQTRSSTTFIKIMSDFELKMQDRLRKQHEALLARQKQEEGEAAAAALETIEDELYEEDEEEEEEVEEVVQIDPHEEKLKKSARRAWQLIKRYINEQRMKNKNQKSGMNWSFLKNTLSQMTNMEKAREDLYKKYLNNDNPREWTKGLSNVPEHIFNKGRAGRKDTDAKTPRPGMPAKRNSKGKGI